MRRKIRYAFKSLLIISVHAGTEGFDLPQRGRRRASPYGGKCPKGDRGAVSKIGVQYSLVFKI